MHYNLSRKYKYFRLSGDFYRSKGISLLPFTLLLTILLSACTARLPSNPEYPSQQVTGYPTLTISYPPPTASYPLLATSDKPTSIATSAPKQAVYVPDYLPPALRNALPLPEGYYATSVDENASYRIDIWSPASKYTQSITWWTYALVAPFPTIPSQVLGQDLRNSWQGDSSGPFAGVPLLLDEPTSALFTAWWGEFAPGSVHIVPAESLVDTAWAQHTAWAIVPFEALEPRWKVISIDGISPLSKDFDPTSYLLSMPIALTTPPGLYDWTLSIGNRNSHKLTIVNMTGVTAMVRGTALWMERYGISYPAQDVGNLLASADITHINNEVPFFLDCPYPELETPWLISCSPPSYIKLLDLVGADVIELTGDHFGDWPPESMDLTLDIYHQHNMVTFGGGLNAESARLPALFEHNGNKLAFIGCHIGGDVKTETPEDALATADLPGAAACDFEWLSEEIPALTRQGYQVIFTFQHQEIYSYTPTPRLVSDFKLPAQMGATIVSGSQAHQPHGLAFEEGAFIHYGLGNLFFDQYHYCADFACDNAFIDRHVFYAGRHISTELIPIKFVDLARPRLMTPDEAAYFLEVIFTASGW